MVGQVVERGAAILGYALLGHMALLVMAVRVRTAATLPGGHAVRCVTDSKWISIPCKVCACPDGMAMHGCAPVCETSAAESYMHDSAEAAALSKSYFDANAMPAMHLPELQEFAALLCFQHKLVLSADCHADVTCRRLH